jgi:hypothetical protein
MNEELELWKKRLPTMTQEELAYLYRYAPIGHPVFVAANGLYNLFHECFKGFTPEISKQIDKKYETDEVRNFHP